MSKQFFLTNDIKNLREDSGAIALLEAKSSNVYGVGYRKGLLYILFNTYTIYQYKKVPFDIVRGLFSVVYFKKGSVGTYFSKNIKKGGYTYKKTGIASYLKNKLNNP